MLAHLIGGMFFAAGGGVFAGYTIVFKLYSQHPYTPEIGMVLASLAVLSWIMICITLRPVVNLLSKRYVKVRINDKTT